MTVNIPCGRCSQPIEVTQEQIDQIVSEGLSLGHVQHESCPQTESDDPEPQLYVYRAEIVITRQKYTPDADVPQEPEREEMARAGTPEIVGVRFQDVIP